MMDPSSFLALHVRLDGEIAAATATNEDLRHIVRSCAGSAAEILGAFCEIVDESQNIPFEPETVAFVEAMKDVDRADGALRAATSAFLARFLALDEPAEFPDRIQLVPELLPQPDYGLETMSVLGALAVAYAAEPSPTSKYELDSHSLGWIQAVGLDRANLEPAGQWASQCWGDGYAEGIEGAAETVRALRAGSPPAFG